MATEEKKRLIVCCCDDDTQLGGDCKRFALVDPRQVRPPDRMAPAELLIATERLSVLLDAAAATRDDVMKFVRKTYGCLLRCCECQVALTPDLAYFLGTWDEYTANQTSICRTCYLKNHNTQPYKSNGPRVYFFVKQTRGERREFRLEFDNVPSASELHESVRQLIGGTGRAKYRLNGKPLQTTQSLVAQEGTTGFCGEVVVQ